ncbi:hypothetical protein [Streptomyces sp. NRRL S-340]|uniref:hypothetical protein n=1 Tax=Streptomyces sp. NRRL S-340 TaxID=1463901 RepID=UPI00131E2454|nr:hypothetical protein [Streptomyces sp. NRRL S-340]
MAGPRGSATPHVAGLTSTWNSAVVEGHVHRIDMLKGQMHGRAGFGLLRRRILLAGPQLCHPTSGSVRLIAHGTGSGLSLLRHEPTARVTQAVMASRSAAMA